MGWGGSRLIRGGFGSAYSRARAQERTCSGRVPDGSGGKRRQVDAHAGGLSRRGVRASERPRPLPRVQELDGLAARLQSRQLRLARARGLGDHTGRKNITIARRAPGTGRVSDPHSLRRTARC
jgi:hypothetical protein